MAFEGTIAEEAAEAPALIGTEDSSDKKANKAQQGTHIYTYDELNRMVTSDISKVESSICDH